MNTAMVVNRKTNWLCQLSLSETMVLSNLILPNYGFSTCYWRMLFYFVLYKSFFLKKPSLCFESNSFPIPCAQSTWSPEPSINKSDGPQPQPLVAPRPPTPRPGLVRTRNGHTHTSPRRAIVWRRLVSSPSPDPTPESSSLPQSRPSSSSDRSSPRPSPPLAARAKERERERERGREIASPPRRGIRRWCSEDVVWFVVVGARARADLALHLLRHRHSRLHRRLRPRRRLVSSPPTPRSLDRSASPDLRKPPVRAPSSSRVGALFACRGIFITGSSLIGAAIKAPRITSKNLIRCPILASFSSDFVLDRLAVDFVIGRLADAI